METSRLIRSPGSGHRIERAGTGYAVLSHQVRIWVPTLTEAKAARDELEQPGWRRAALPCLGGRRSRPPGAVVYGPVVSRRLGNSLGVNLMRPGRSVCSFHCVYCEFPRRHCRDPYGDWPTPAAVAAGLAHALPRCGPLDSITVSGSGEPTSHPDFAAVVGQVLAEARRARPDVPVRILTNGATTVRPEIRRALDQLDERIITLDAAAERVDKPDADSPLGGVVYGISLLRDFSLQSCFIDGRVSNVEDETVRQWADLVGELEPRRVQIFTVSRRPAFADIHPVPEDQLEEIACTLRARTGIEARVFA